MNARVSGIILLAAIFSHLGEREKAVETANKITDNKTRRTTLLYVRRRQEQLKILQEEFHSLTYTELVARK